MLLPLAWLSKLTFAASEAVAAATELHLGPAVPSQQSLVVQHTVNGGTSDS